MDPLLQYKMCKITKYMVLIYRQTQEKKKEYRMEINTRK